MKVAILAGGLGTRLQEVTTVKPKPLVEIGGQPVIWHIMKIYAAQGFNEFVVALGYKGELIKDYFMRRHYHSSSLTIKPKTGEIKVHNDNCDDWTIHLLDTGANTQTGGRIKRAAEFIGNEKMMVTYGDGVADVNVNELLKFHATHGKLATLTAVRPPSRFGGLKLDGTRIVNFEEKPQISENRINAGFFVLEPQVANYIADDETIFERGPLESLAKEGQLHAFFHDGFWQCMDTVRDVRFLEEQWASGKAAWQIWKDDASNKLSFTPPSNTQVTP
jgi:glucose-1-phosphate cytidylyltransferase